MGIESQGVADTSRSHQSDEQDVQRGLQSPFRVLGIALVVDKLGQGAKMVLRYPVSPLTESTEDLFYRLPPQQMAKLFRPKQALCGQPMTLSVGGTVFCCNAVLMDDGSSTSTSAAGGDLGHVTNEGSDNDDTATTATTTSPATNPLILFSVIVALAPHVRLSSIPITGWLDGQSHDYHSIHMSTSGTGAAESSSSSRVRKVSPSFLSMRRVHVSLARLCRLLEREERRCLYVSLQTSRFQAIRKELEQKWTRAESHNSTLTRSASTDLILASGGAVSPGSNSMASKSTVAQAPTSTSTASGGAASRHRRNNSFTTTASTAPPKAKPERLDDDSRFENNQDFRQEFLDTIMSSSPSATPRDGDTPDTTAHISSQHQHQQYQHHGNLARELIQVYHALARNDHEFSPTPAALLSGRDGIVFVNRHLATAIEAVSPPTDLSLDNSKPPVLRPYQTVLFPHASATELLETLTRGGTMEPPRRLQQFLRTVHAQKSLLDIAAEANLPLQVTLDIARTMVEQGVCVPATVLSGNSRLACRRLDLIPNVSLAFAQAFGDALPVFHLIAYLTKDRLTMGDAMVGWKTGAPTASTVTTSPGRQGGATSHRQQDHRLRERLRKCRGGVLSSGPSLRSLPSQDRKDDDVDLDDDNDNDGQVDHDNDEDDAMEDLLYQMIIWLYSHKVLAQLEEYLVGTTASVSVTGGNRHQQVPNNEDSASAAAEHKTTDAATSNRLLDQAATAGNAAESPEDNILYKDLLQTGCLEGTLSLHACSWQTGVDPSLLRAFALQHPLIRLVVRLPSADDAD